MLFPGIEITSNLFKEQPDNAQCRGHICLGQEHTCQCSKGKIYANLQQRISGKHISSLETDKSISR